MQQHTPDMGGDHEREMAVVVVLHVSTPIAIYMKEFESETARLLDGFLLQSHTNYAQQVLCFVIMV